MLERILQSGVYSIGTIALLTTVNFAHALTFSTPAYHSGATVSFQVGKGKMQTGHMDFYIKDYYGGGAYDENIPKPSASGRISAGYLWRAKNTLTVGLEGGYAKYPGNEYSLGNPKNHDHWFGTDKFDGRYFDLLGVIKYRPFLNINILNKIGLSLVQQQERLKLWDYAIGTANAQSYIIKERKFFKFLPEIAIGIGFEFIQNLNVNFSYHYIFGNKVEPFDTLYTNSTEVYTNLPNKIASVENLWLGFTYQFGTPLSYKYMTHPVFPFYHIGWIASLQAGFGQMAAYKMSYDMKNTFGGGNYDEETPERHHSGRISGGYLWRVNNDLDIGVESGYAKYHGNKYSLGNQNIATNEYGTDEFQGYYIDLLGVTKYRLYKRLNILNKFGVALVRQKETLHYWDYYVPSPGPEPPYVYTIKRRKFYRILPEVSVGLGWDLNKNVNFNLSYHHVFGDDKTDPFVNLDSPLRTESLRNKSLSGKIASVDNFWLGLTYQFG